MKSESKTNYPILVLALLLNLLSGGVVFGWGVLVVLLQKQGVYKNYCAASSGTQLQQQNVTVSSASSSSSFEICTEQQLRLNTVFLLGTFGSMSMSFPSGYFMDKTSSKLTVIIGVLFQILGSALFSCSSETLEMFAIGYFFMGAAAPFMLLGGVTLAASNVEEKRKGFYISILNGCYDASAIVWQIYVWLDSNFENGLSYSMWFLIYIGLNFLLLISILFIVPGNFLQHDDNENDSDTNAKAGGMELTDLQQPKSTKVEDNIKEENENTEVKVPLSDKPLRSQLKSTEFIVFAVFFCIGLLRFSYYIGSIDAQLTWLGQVNGNYSIIFGSILPFGIFSTPFIGMLIDSKGLTSGFVVIYFFKFLHSILTMVPNLNVQIAGMVCFAIFRGCFFATCSAYLIDTFGLKMGKVFGAAATVGAISSLSQSALLALSLSVNSFLPSNLIVLGLTISVCLLHAWYFNCRRRD